jgi:hypothetical protein
MTRIPRDFDSRDAREKQWLIENTWCDHCNAADLGIQNPFEYEDGGHVYVEGYCRGCGSRVKSEIVENNSDG